LDFLWCGTKALPFKAQWSICTSCFNIENAAFCPWSVPCDSHNRQRLFPWTALTGWSLCFLWGSNWLLKYYLDESHSSEDCHVNQFNSNRFRFHVRCSLKVQGNAGQTDGSLERPLITNTCEGGGSAPSVSALKLGWPVKVSLLLFNVCCYC
jgi:hypothetical protein